MQLVVKNVEWVTGLMKINYIRQYTIDTN